METRLKGIASILLWVLGSSVFAAAVSGEVDPSPYEVVEATAMAVADRMDGRKEFFTENPAELYKLVDELLLPHFDVRYAGYLVLGKHWKTASAEQRDRFVDVFYQILLQSYANGILEFEQGAIVVLPPEAEQKEKRAVVKTRTRMDDGSEVPINYSMRRTSKGWLVYDVRIEGVSYVQNYRNQFNAEIAALGVDAVIDRLTTDVAAAAAR